MASGCFRCGGMGHIARDCPTPKGKGKGTSDGGKGTKGRVKTIKGRVRRKGVRIVARRVTSEGLLEAVGGREETESCEDLRARRRRRPRFRYY